MLTTDFTFIGKIDDDNNDKTIKYSYLHCDNNMYIFGMDNYIQNIRKSYKNKQDIITQFNLDAPRSDVFINNERIMNYIDLKLGFPSHYDDQMICTIATLSSQASLAFPYTVLHESCADTDNGIYIFSSDSSVNVQIDIGTHGFKINTMKVFQTRNIMNNTELYKIKLELVVEYCNNNKQFANGLLLWSFIT